MPHQCDSCGNIIDKGAEELLDGCGECGGCTFQFVSGTPNQEPEESENIIDGEDPVRTQEESVEDSAQSAARGEILTPDETSEYSGSAGDLVSGLQSSSDEDDTPIREAEVDEDVVGELPSEEAESGQDDTPSSEPDREVVTDTSQLQNALSQEFESIRIIEPGTYELNLRKLYDREEHIIQIKEDGKYVIQMPER